MSTYPNAHANAKKWIFDVHFPRKRFEFGILSNDFRSSTILAFQIQVSFPGVKIAKNPGIQPTYRLQIFYKVRFSNSVDFPGRPVYDGGTEFR